MSATANRKRKNEAQPEESEQPVLAFVVQSRQRVDIYSESEYETHAVFSTLKKANEGARRIYNDPCEDAEPITKADLAAAYAACVKPGGRRVWHIEDEDSDGDAPKSIVFTVTGEASIETGPDVGEGEELKVWVMGYGVDADMPEEE